MKNSYEVLILNQKFILKTEGDEAHVRRIADYVNSVFEEIRSRAQNVSTQNVAILGALNIAERMLDQEAETREMVARWKSRLEVILGE